MPGSEAKILAHRREVGVDLYRAKTDLYWLAGKLGYYWSFEEECGLTDSFHKPECARFDRLRDHPKIGFFAARGSHKTTILECLCCQEILRNKDICVLICHAIDEEVEKTVQGIGNLILKNEWFRAMLAASHGKPASPVPSKTGKWLGANKFTILSRSKYNKQPTVLGKGAGSEITGAHVDLIFLDDIIARRTLLNSQIPEIKRWLQNTIMPVAKKGTKKARIRVFGTRWAEDDPYGDMIASEDWDTVVRGSLESIEEVEHDDGSVKQVRVIDRAHGKPVHYGPVKGDPVGLKHAMKSIKSDMADMRQDFDPQMQNDPSPAGEKPWVASECEHRITLKEARGNGTVFVLSDPAPAKTGSFGGQGESERKDGTKDFWANCVVKIRPNGSRQEIILLDGTYSREWSKDEGFDEICRLAKKWGTPLVGMESTGQAIALYMEDLRRAARKMGCSYHPVRLLHTYRGKNQYFASLTSRAKSDEFLIADSVPPDFLDEFLEQARHWRPLGPGKNGLKYDDVANAVSFATDTGLQEYAPKVEMFDPFDEMYEDEQPQMRSRYCAV